MSDRRVMGISGILVLLLAISITANAFLAVRLSSSTPPSTDEMRSTIEDLDAKVKELSHMVEERNLTIRNYESQLVFYREAIAEMRGQLNAGNTAVQGFATLEGPAVLQRTEVIREGPFLTTQTRTEGAMLNISVEIRQGEGRVLVHTTPLMGVVFQDAANTAVFVAQNITGKELYGNDVIFSVEAEDEVPAVDGPSAGALMTALVIAALEHELPRQDITLTGTIDAKGHVGAIGGVVEKAHAANESGKSYILLPKENAKLVQYTETVSRRGGFTFVQRVPVVVDAKEYIEREIGIGVIYVDTIQDVMRQLGIGQV
ncbi:MAG: hypothetical protein QHG99_06310 [Methanomicrobiales archaeon]|nr:hypothetical protein [Methanomicrobiales archaeon]